MQADVYRGRKGYSMTTLSEHLIPLGRKVLGFFRPERDIRFETYQVLFPDADPAQLLPPKTIPTPELAGATCVPGVSQYEAATYTCPALEAVELENVLYCPTNNVVLTEEGQIVAESSTTIRRPEYIDSHAISARRIENLPGIHTALRSRFNHYYHHLIDHASRLHFLGHPALANGDTVGLLLRDGPTSFETYLLDRLKPPHVEPILLHSRRLYRIERYLLLTPMTRRHAGYQRASYLKAFERVFLPDRPSRQSERIYIGRRPKGSKGRRVLNESDVMQALHPMGFTHYLLEDLSFEEQCRLFYDADAVVAAHGAGLANLIYAKHASVIEYFPSRHVVPSFYFLAKSKGLSYRRLHGAEAWREDDFEMDVPRLLSALDEFGIH